MKLTTVDTDAKTVVISEEELGEIKHTPKQITKAETAALEKEEYDDNDYDDAEDDYESGKRSGKKKKHGAGRGLTIAALLGGTVLLVVLVVVLGRAAGLLEQEVRRVTRQNRKQKAHQTAWQQFRIL